MSAPVDAPHDGVAPVVLVTGSAGAIGSATVCALARAGFRVVGFDRVAPAASVDGLTSVVADVTDAASLDEAVAGVRTLGPLAHVIGIAGGALPGEPQSQHEPGTVDADLFRRSLEANLVSQFLVVRATHAWLRDGAKGHDRSITFTSSWNGLSAQGMPGYSAAKAGLIGLMHSMVGPLGAEGVRVNVVAPGTVRTPRTEKLYASDPHHFDRLARGTATGRVAEPEDVAEAYLGLLRMRHVTGQVLVVDGGQMSIRR